MTEISSFQIRLTHLFQQKHGLYWQCCNLKPELLLIPKRSFLPICAVKVLSFLFFLFITTVTEMVTMGVVLNFSHKGIYKVHKWTQVCLVHSKPPEIVIVQRCVKAKTGSFLFLNSNLATRTRDPS